MVTNLSKRPSVAILAAWCKGCGICVKACPKAVLSLNDSGRAFVANGEACTGCAQCEVLCPDFAIEVEVDRS